jgi:hypothetical protein
MAQEDIVKMAREAGFNPVSYTGANLELFERFAALVAAHEREACAKVCEERQEVFQKYYTKGLAAMCAEAIRARGNK